MPSFLIRSFPLQSASFNYQYFRFQFQLFYLEPFSGVETHMEMDMDRKWMKMRHNLSKCYGLVWIWGGHQLKTIR